MIRGASSGDSSCVEAIVLDTGIVQGQGQVVAIEKRQDFRSIQVKFPVGKVDGIQIGASVAINGTCLTVRRAQIVGRLYS